MRLQLKHRANPTAAPRGILFMLLLLNLLWRVLLCALAQWEEEKSQGATLASPQLRRWLGRALVEPPVSDGKIKAEASVPGTS